MSAPTAMLRLRRDGHELTIAEVLVDGQVVGVLPFSGYQMIGNANGAQLSLTVAAGHIDVESHVPAPTPERFV